MPSSVPSFVTVGPRRMEVARSVGLAFLFSPYMCSSVKINGY